MPSFYEFFAGGGMARMGLGPSWRCLFANDIDAKKGETYRLNWNGGHELQIGDIADVRADELPGYADLVWGSFPCQDLSLAGNGAGLKGGRSGTFYTFWEVISGLIASGRAPKVVAVENVCGTLTSRGGKDFEAICTTFHQAGYAFGALVVNADLFVPQSRPRLFVIGVRRDSVISDELLSATPSAAFHTTAIKRAVENLPGDLREGFVWWRLPMSKGPIRPLSELIEENPVDVPWHSPTERERLLSMMSATNREKVEQAQRNAKRTVGCIYRRTRKNAFGERIQRAEVRFDDVSGCLRTPAGGSSRQIILVVDGSLIRSRLISARETARLMGLPDSYALPSAYNEAYHLTGDGVVAPVVRHLAQHLFEPLILDKAKNRAAA
jgi:DNA (cytosine-5)-methyltransferase 1